MSITLPEPDNVAQALSHQLKQQIFAEIDLKGPMTFARYMELALYAPNLGYYRSGTQKFGEQGDFITAPELSPLFSQCIARQCQQILQDWGSGDILEFGAGSGIMACDILKTLTAVNQLPEHYYIMELSAELRHRQRQTLQNQAPDLLSRVIWLDRLPEQKLQAVILANEVLDAMPVHRFFFAKNFQECYVTKHQDQFAWELGPLSSAALAEEIHRLEIDFPENYSSEINLLINGWLASISAMLAQGVVLLLDYGMPRREYYHPDRRAGTLLCHYRHRAHENPFWWPGLQDITAQVDFTAVAEAAIQHDFSVEGYTHQAAFLLNCGITQLISEVEDPLQRLPLTQQIKKLTLPAQMGESFKAMALSKNYDQALLGFATMNQLERL